VSPTDPAFDFARRSWNLAVEQKPAAVVFPESAQDVAAAVGRARDAGLRVVAQTTGHNAGPLGSLHDTMLLKTERMRRITIDPQRRRAHVEAGALMQELVDAAAEHGLATLAWSSPDIGVAGYTLGGGLSFVSRKYGLACNTVHAIELVTADGRLHRADHDTEPDLFWALRGGGGSFGVVTALDLQLFPITEVNAGALWYPIDRGADVLDTWRDLTDGNPPDELTTIARFLNLPEIPDIPSPLRGKSFVIVEAYHLGHPAAADELLAPLRALQPVNDTIRPVPISALTHLHLDPEQPVPYAGDGLLISDLPDDALRTLTQVAGASAAVPLTSVEMRHLDGQLSCDQPGHGALPRLDARYAMFAVGITPTPEQHAEVHGQVQAVNSALHPWTAQHRYLNFTESRQPINSFWPEAAYRRLQQIKASIDPDNVIRANHPIPAIHD
jgi:FAD binding domain-containing protein/berberine-like enzyme